MTNGQPVNKEPKANKEPKVINNQTIINNHTVINKQKLTIIICVPVFAVLLVVYLAFIRPLLKTATAETKPPELLEGEVLGANNRVLMFPHTEKADILSIEVHNEKGTYKFYRGFKGDNDNFYIEGMEGAPYSLELLSSLVVSSGYTLAMPLGDGSPRLNDPSDDLSVYGLAESDNPAWYLLTTMSGKTYKVLIGNQIPTGGGYYCMFDGRNAVYVLDSSLSSTLLADVKSMITPSLGYPISTSDMFKVDDFQIIKEKKLFLWVDTLTAEESGKDLPSYEAKFPAGMQLNVSTYSELLQVFSSFAGTETVACGSEVAKLDSAMLKEKYGIDIEAPYYLVHYKVGDIETYIEFSAPDEDGNMYAYSTVYNLVAKINIASAAFINWDILQYVSPAVFGDNINDVSKIEVKGSINNGANEKLDVDTYFTLAGEKNEKGQKDDIIIKKKGSDKKFDEDEVKNFRQFYKTILGIKLQGRTDSDETDKMTLLCEMTVTRDNGEVLEFKFWSYSTRRCFYTVNGEGEYYTLRDSVEKLIRDADKIMSGLPVNSDNKN